MIIFRAYSSCISITALHLAIDSTGEQVAICNSQAARNVSTVSKWASDTEYLPQRR